MLSADEKYKEANCEDSYVEEQYYFYALCWNDVWKCVGGHLRHVRHNLDSLTFLIGLMSFGVKGARSIRPLSCQAHEER